jgi:hypothetical protein
MELLFEETFLTDLLTAHAEATGHAAQLRALAALREEDGLDGATAIADAAESLGQLEEIRELLLAALSPLAEWEIERIRLTDVYGGMPTFRREGARAEVAVAPAPVREVCVILERLVARVAEDPERTAVVLPIGLGGTGGCACGDELPEDAPPGPLFERRS